MIFESVILHDFAKPLRKRLESRKVCGPYTWRPTPPGAGRGFYMASRGFACAPHGSSIDLRLEKAGDLLPSGARLANTTGFYTDDYGDSDTIQPIVARLPNRRGFLIGWTMGPGMCASLEPEIYQDAESAAYAAYSHAEYVAENEREYQETHRDDC